MGKYLCAFDLHKPIASQSYIQDAGVRLKSQIRLQPCFLTDDTFNRFLYVTIDLLLEIRRPFLSNKPSSLFTQLHPFDNQSPECG